VTNKAPEIGSTSPELDAALARLAVDLLSGPAGDLVNGAGEATQRGLAGLFLYGLSTRDTVGDRLPPATEAATRRGALREVADEAVSVREIGEILEALGRRGHHPLVLKGRLLAVDLWPRPHHRPPGDLDLLLEPEEIPDAIEALSASGYRPLPAWRHPEICSVILQPAAGRLTPVDLHWRLFEMIGSRIETAPILGRARPAMLAGHRVRRLESADELLFLLIHAAGHGFSRLKWLLDLYALALRSDPLTWENAVERALASRTSRPFHVSAAILAALPGLSIDPVLLESIAPARPVRSILARLVRQESAVRERPVLQWDRYALHLLLEESLWTRARRATRLLQRFILDHP
jgi:Uncharacterised nucleotidyltransferase